MINMILKKLRLSSNYTQEQVALTIGVSRQAVAKWENGTTTPDIYNCMALAKLYGVSIDSLVTDSDDTRYMEIPPKGKHVFGLVKVGERGQIVIPKKAREIFQINSGDYLIVLGDEAQGIALAKHDRLMNFVESIFQAEECKED